MPFLLSEIKKTEFRSIYSESRFFSAVFLQPLLQYNHMIFQGKRGKPYFVRIGIKEKVSFYKTRVNFLCTS